METRGAAVDEEIRLWLLIGMGAFINPEPPTQRIPSSPPRPDRLGRLFTANTHPPEPELPSHGNPTADTRKGMECSPIRVG